MGALVVDLGLLYVEREELQTGADAGALAVAAACAEGPAECTQSKMDPLAEAGYADVNSADGLADATVCGHGIPSLGVECEDTPDVGNLTDCLPMSMASPAVPAGAPYVEVRTTTELPDGDFAIPPAFAGTITGYGGATIRACSRVSWGPAGRARLEPAMAISRCFWEANTSNGTVYQPRPASASDPYAGVDPTKVVSLPWRAPSSGTPSTCGGLPDGFGWFEDVDSSCRRTVSTTNWYAGWTDASNPAGCANILENAFASAHPLTVAIIDQANEPTHANEYRVAGIARFVVTGWSAQGFWPGRPTPASNPSALGSPSCSEDFCVFGYFTTGVLSAGTGALGDPHYGAIYLRTIG
jgi:hypothetical protein